MSVVTTHRAVLATVAIVALILGVAPVRAEAPAMAPNPSVPSSRLQLQLDTSSGWAAVEMQGLEVLGINEESRTPGTTISIGAQGFAIQTTEPAASASVTLVVAVPRGAAPTMVVRKGYIGQATARLLRTNSAPAPVATLHNARSADDQNRVSLNVSADEVLGEGLHVPAIDPRRLTLAFYYPWFTKDSFEHGLWYDTPSGPSDTSDPTQVAQMVGQARGAGVDGFLVSWSSENHYERFDLVLDAAAAVGASDFFVAPYLEIPSMKSQALLATDQQHRRQILDSTRAALERATNPAFLHTPDGRPVLFVYGAEAVDPSVWTAVMKSLSLSGHDPFVVGDSLNPSFDFEGYHFYNPNKTGDSLLEERYTSASRRARVPAALGTGARQLLWAATVSPGQFDAYVHPLSPTVRDREGGTRYERTWRAAVASDPEWILVTSWNEWYEATHIAPGRRTASVALQQTSDWDVLFAQQPSGTVRP